MDRSLIIFIKNPQKGAVKTRLAADIGELNALKVYSHLLEHTRKIAADVDADRLLFYSKFIPGKDEWPSLEFEKYLQKGDDLGLRMHHAFDVAFSKGYQRVIIIGSDCVELNSDLITEAFDHLNTHDFVVGPANDGGYYLLGMNSAHPGLFKNKAWSTETVFRETILEISNLSKTVYALPNLSDIDTFDDLNKDLLNLLDSIN